MKKLSSFVLEYIEFPLHSDDFVTSGMIACFGTVAHRIRIADNANRE